MFVPHVGSRTDFMRWLLDSNDGGGTGGAPDGGTPDGGDKGGKPNGNDPTVTIDDLIKSDALKEYLKNQSADVISLVEEEISGLKTALDKERGNKTELRAELEKDLRDQIVAEERVKFATENAKKALEEGETAGQLKDAQEELKKAQAELDRRTQRDSFRESIKTQDLGALEEILITLRFGEPDDLKKALEKLGALRNEDIAAEISRRLPNSKPPDSGDTSTLETEPLLQYPSME